MRDDIGTGYNNNPSNYYNRVFGHYWHIYLHFQHTTASEELN